MKEVTGICVIRGKEENSIFGAAHRLLSLSVPPHLKFLRWGARLCLVKKVLGSFPGLSVKS